MLQDIRTRSDIENIITTFYTTVRADADLGYLFDEVARVNWQQHIPIITDFWEQIVLGTGEYHRNAMEPHFLLHKKSPLTALHFTKWLQHFTTTIDMLHSGEKADNMKERAASIASVMQYKIISQNSGKLM